MTRVQTYLIVVIVSALFSTTLGSPIFWLLPWSSWLNPTTTSSTSSGTSSTSTATARTPSNVSIAIGDRTNTTAGLDDMGTVIDGLTINAGRRRRSAQQLPEVDFIVPSNESYIQIGNHVIRLPSRNISNITINVVDGVPYVGAGGLPAPPQDVPPNLFDHIKNFFDGVFNRTN
ncbi:uncharacterized protein LOC6047887 [Culex quinquefasciatus]|uniref:uncharacterized protein LOC6047887 n=1 Tax=Culex quinquefasciatus TaxID=7176 RepID=UPI0018E2F0DC|nr:uncharacterized protein LOC6047887 [Culex quinquefasciatus]